MFDVLMQPCQRHHHGQSNQPATTTGTSSGQPVGPTSAPKSLQKTWCQLKSAAESMKPKKVRCFDYLEMIPQIARIACRNTVMQMSE